MTKPNSNFDAAIVGGGVFGLWIARQCAAAGLRTCLVDKAKPGSGASGGLLGALMPHIPDRWNAKKQFQFEALCALPGLVADLEAETGIASGYRRTGRLMPIRNPQFRDQVDDQHDGSKIFWRESGLDLRLERLDGAEPNNWLDAGAAPLGFMRETLAARINPRAYLAALSASVRKTCTVLEGFEVAAVDSAAGTLQSAGGETLQAERIVLTAGYESFALLHALTGVTLGKGVKGQAVMLETREDPASPILFDDGTYIIVHDDGRTAVGSTAEPEWSDATRPDPSRNAFLTKAHALVPRLKDAPVVEWWAHVRPKTREREPIVGVLPGHPRIIAATGGFKISFGIAHKIADAVVAVMAGQTPNLPETFTTAHHFEKARLRTEKQAAAAD